MLTRGLAKSCSSWWAEENAQGEKIFTWTDTRTNKEEISLYLFEEDAIFERIPNAPGRCFWLHFKSFEDRYFFWFQNPDESKDNETCRRINELINLAEQSVVSQAPTVHQPPTPQTNSAPQTAPAQTAQQPSGTPGATPGLNPQALQNAMRGYLPNCLAGLANKVKSAFNSP